MRNKFFSQNAQRLALGHANGVYVLATALKPVAGRSGIAALEGLFLLWV
jgi:hypothetical protein